MRVVVQRVSQSSVIIESDIVSSISKGLLILLGVENNDTLDDVNWLIRKIINLRIFNDICAHTFDLSPIKHITG